MNVKHDKEKVLKTGLGMFCNKGYNSLGVDEICKVTGMTKGAFYNAFKSKEQFLIEAILLYAKNNVNRIKAQLQSNNTQTAYERLLQFYVNMLDVQPKVNFMGCFINNIMSELGAANEKVGLASTQAFDEFIDAIEPTVMEAQQNNELNSEWNARQITELLHSTFYGSLTRAKSSKDNEQGINTMKLLFNNLKTTK
ncbi:MAG: TetR/AcrR family transcriptional regulator [Lewinellaceae bacterium]|nr:TetR/AcrR family transcriptional regulator [Lewinellaceae bacterium]